MRPDSRRHDQSAPEDEDDFLDPPSKSSRKRDMHALQDLGEQLVALSPERLKKVPLPDALYEAIRAAQGFKMEARRRQLQYVGKQMRAVDPEPYRQAVAAFKLGSAQDTLRLHETEKWRAELLADDEALTRWAADHPDSDLQQLRSLIRHAQHEAAHNKPPAAARKVFKYIRELDEVQRGLR